MNLARNDMTRDFGTRWFSQYTYLCLKITLANPQILFIGKAVAATRDASPGTEFAAQWYRKICQGVKPFDFCACQLILKIKLILLKWPGNGPLGLKLHIFGLNRRLQRQGGICFADFLET